MTFSAIAKTYLRELQEHLRQAEATGEFTPELSYRPLTDYFLKALCDQICPDAKVVFEPKKQAHAGRPDWRVYNDRSYGVYGYIEAKAINCSDPIQPEQHADQLERYLGLGAKVILTDGLDFIFYRPGSKKPMRVGLVEKPLPPPQLSNAIPNLDLERAFRNFLEEPSFRISSETNLIRECALRARRLSDEISAFVEMPLLSGLSEEENRNIKALHDLKGVLESHHDQTLNTPHAFADFVAQVLVFGLLYAHRVVSAVDETPKVRDADIKRFWTDVAYSSHAEKLRPFSALVSLLGNELNSLGPLGTWYTDCRLMLAHTDLANDGAQPDFHQLYERFLEVFDKKVKFDYGAFYTPRPLAQYALRLSEAVLGREFPARSFYEFGNRLIDPCCGTGTFLELLVRSASQAQTFPQIAGFEILPAPYALAHYRLAMCQAGSAAAEKTKIVLTNSLSDALEETCESANEDNAATKIIIKEQARAREISQAPLMLIIGNPPSSDSPCRGDPKRFTIINKLIDDFRPPEQYRRSRQNIQKQTQNEFVFFLRWACRKLETDSGVGVLCFVLPNSFLENPSYVAARHWLLEHFNGLWVLEIDADLRRGVQVENLFDTRQGRCLLIGLRKPGPGARATRGIGFASIAGLSKNQKISYLTNDAPAKEWLTAYKNVEVRGPECSFRSAGTWDTALYEMYWPLCPATNNPKPDELFIFARHCSGLKLAPSNLLVHAKKPILIRRSKEIAGSSKDYDALRREWFSGQQKPPGRDKLTDAVKSAMRAAVEAGSVRPYSYRPFLTMYGLLTPVLLDALSKTKGGGTRARPEVWSAFMNRQVIGVAVAPSPKELSGELTRFASFCWAMPDNDLSRRGNAHVFCNYFPEYKVRSDGWTGETTSNVHSGLVKALGLTSVTELPAETAITFYCYAVLCSGWYLSRFSSALFRVNSWPRIPFPKDADLFLSVTNLGRQLAEFENPSISPPLEQEHDIALRNWSDFRVVGYKADEDAGTLTLEGSEGESRIIGDLEPEVLRFSAGGYQVIREWLKFHSYAYSRSTFRSEDLQELRSVCARIRGHLEIAAEADKVLASFADNESALLGAATRSA